MCQAHLSLLVDLEPVSLPTSPVRRGMAQVWQPGGLISPQRLLQRKKTLLQAILETEEELSR
jgi:hypothetical protein